MRAFTIHSAMGKDFIHAGWLEYASFPELGIQNSVAKLDTGAYNSSIHARNISVHCDPSAKDSGKGTVTFTYSPTGKAMECCFPIYDIRAVKSSNGEIQQRIYIKTRIQMGDKNWPIIINLADRSRMRFPVLIGRNSLRDNVIIHPGKKFMTREFYENSDHIPE